MHHLLVNLAAPPVWAGELGRLHVVLVHFPIALLLVAATVELWSAIRRRRASVTGGVCLVLGAVAAGMSAWSGWVHADSFKNHSSTLNWHFWLGMATAVVAGVSLVLLGVMRWRPGMVGVYRVALVLCGALVAATGHFGGTLTHGEGYLTELLFRKEQPVVVAPGTAVKISFPADGRIVFARDVRPVFAQSCYECHSAVKHKGELRLDSKMKALEGGNSGKAILPGKPGESLVMQHVLGINGKKRMPVNGPPLPEEQVRILRAWIEQGATWPEALKDDVVSEKTHWAYLKPVRVEPPVVKDGGWVRNPIDNFVLARLEAEGMQPSPEADRVTLIRRLTLDLIGLPPTPDEVDAFVADTSEDAYGRLVNRLLASPHYGERWGRHWLDLARYADTNGYEKDNPRVIWPYRDWVINALNRDVTFDQFVIQQIAGDMLPNASPEDRIASGFHRNTMYNEEGGIDIEEFRFKAIVDRVQTTSTAFLGLTMHCAQCHNHKYDAISQKEYYQFFSMLNSADEPDYKIPAASIAEQRREIEGKIAKVESEFESSFPADEARVEYVVIKPETFKASSGAALAVKDDSSLLASGKSADKETYTVEANADLGGATGVRLEVLEDATLPKKGPGRAKNGNFVLSEFKVGTVEKGATTKPVEFSGAEADFSQDKFPVANAIDGKPETGWAIDRSSGRKMGPHTATFTFKEKPGAGTKRILFTLDQNHVSFPAHTLGRFRLSLVKPVTTLPSTRPVEVRRKELLAKKFKQWEEETAAKCSHWTVVEPVKYSRLHGATITKLEDNTLLFTGDNYYREQYDVDYAVPMKGVTGIKLEVLPHADLPKDGPGRNPNGGFVLSEITGVARALKSAATQPATRPVEFESATADVSNDTVERAIDGRKDTHWTVGVGGGVERVAVFALKQKMSDPPDGGTLLSLAMAQNYFQSENLGRIRVSVTTDPKPVASGVPGEIEGILVQKRQTRMSVPPEGKEDPHPASPGVPGEGKDGPDGASPSRGSGEEKDERTLKKYFLSVTPLLAGKQAEVAALKASMPAYQTTLVMKERATPRTTRIHHRGEYLQEREEVGAAVPGVLPPLPNGMTANRMTLARWLVDPANPLVARVTMNRMWARYFGRGIVNTVDDFGVMGEKPSHPELLDWLATEFIRQNWSMKAMHRMIVSSATYRQSSRVTPDLLKRDPGNVLYARGPRFREDAEVVRDIALRVSGLLNETVGGPSVFPPQPEGVTELSYGPMAWKTSVGADRYRRGMYTFLKRTSMYPGLTVFDAPSSEVTCPKRARSNTPLQALTILNDAVYVEAAQALARRVVENAAGDADERIREVFRLCVGRRPDEKELAAVRSFYEAQIKRFGGKGADPTAVTGGMSQEAKKVNVNELAAWTTVARAVLNLDETVTRE